MGPYKPQFWMMIKIPNFRKIRSTRWSEPLHFWLMIDGGTSIGMGNFLPRYYPDIWWFMVILVSHSKEPHESTRISWFMSPGMVIFPDVTRGFFFDCPSRCELLISGIVIYLPQGSLLLLIFHRNQCPEIPWPKKPTNCMVRRPREAMVRCDAKVEKALGKPVLEDRFVIRTASWCGAPTYSPTNDRK